MRDADELHVGEHGARALATIIKQGIDTGCDEIGVDFFGGLAHGGRFVRADRAYGDGERRDRVGEDDAFGIVSLLDGRADDAGDTDAVATHHHERRFAGFV